MKTPLKEKVEKYLECDDFCPWCGSTDLDASHLESDISSTWQNNTCNSCGAKWQDIYKLVSICWSDEYGNRIYSKEVMNDCKNL